MASKIKGITIEINGNTTKLEESLKGVNKTIYSCNSELKSLNQALKLDPKNTQLLAEKQDVLKKNISASAEKLKELKEAQKQMGSYNKLTEEQKEQYRALSVEITKSASALKNLKKEAVETTKAKFDSLTSGLKKVGDVAATTAKTVAGIAAGVTAAAAATAKAMFDSAKATAEYGDEIDKNAQKAGLSAEAYQKWDYAMQISGSSMSDTLTGMKTLTNKFDDFKNGGKGATETFEKLGISLNEVKNMSREDVFGLVVQRLQNVTDETEKAALANDLFGKSGQELMPMFNMTNEETQKLLEETEKYGMVMSGDAVKASADFQDSLTKLQKTTTGLKNKLTGTLLPGITQVMNGFSDLVSGSDKTGEGIKKGIETITNVIRESLPTIIKTITDLIPMLLPVLQEIILTITQTLMDNLPTIVRAGVDLLLALIMGIVKMIPDLIPVIVDCVLTIVDALVDNIDLIVNAGVELLIGLGIGLIKAIPKVLAKIPEIMGKLWDGFKERVHMFVELGGEILSGILSGLMNIGTKIKDAVKNVGDKIKNGFKNFFGIHSPSKLMSDEVGSFIGEGVTEGIIDGIEETENKVNNAMKQLASGIETSVNPTINPTANTNPLIIQIENFINNRESDIQKLAQELEFYRRNSALAKGGN